MRSKEGAALASVLLSESGDLCDDSEGDDSEGDDSEGDDSESDDKVGASSLSGLDVPLRREVSVGIWSPLLICSSEA